LRDGNEAVYYRYARYAIATTPDNLKTSYIICPILEEAEKLYNELTTKLADSTIAAAVAIRVPPLPSIGNNNNKQKLPHNNNTYDEREELYNNSQLGIYNNDQE
jgi:hypothetical protein